MPDHERPNLLFILTDEQRFDALSCAGSRFVRTPNIDRLAREGVRFTNAVTPSPICAPARTSIFTGMPIHAAGCTTNVDLVADRAGLPDSYDALLTRNGWSAGYVGRWHAPEALAACYEDRSALEPFAARYRVWLRRHGYEPVRASAAMPYVSEYSGQPYGPDPMDHRMRVATHGHGHARREPGLPYGRDSVPSDHSLSAMVADDAITAIDRLAGGPFSLTASFLFPHDPLIVPRPFCDRVAAADMELPATFDDARRNTPYETFTWRMDEVERRHARLFMARYYAATEEVDHHIGRVLDHLERRGLAGNTLVVFTSDHGEMLGDHGLMTKFVHYRESVGVPLLLRMPGYIPAGRIVDAPVGLTGLYATIADYLGVRPPGDRDASLRPWIDGRDPVPDPIVFSQFERWNVMARTREWKYVWSDRPGDVDMLFDLVEDPAETTNFLGAHPGRSRCVDRAEAMKARLVEWMERTGHPWRERVAASEIR